MTLMHTGALWELCNSVTSHIHVQQNLPNFCESVHCTVYSTSILDSPPEHESKLRRPLKFQSSQFGVNLHCTPGLTFQFHNTTIDEKYSFSTLTVLFYTLTLLKGTVS